MRRLFWMGVGAAGAVWVARRAKRAMTALPETVTTAVAQQAGQARVRVSGAASEALAAFRAARTERESELVEALLVEPAGGTERRPRTATRTSRAERASADPWDDDPWGPEDDEDD
jgi:post-segregation antitoxin (ccd killing protein)